MLHIKNLEILQKHSEYLASVIQQAPIFFVGGCIRDILLGIEKNPKDIDITLAANPKKVRESMCFDETTMSRFRTEKFGTMTILPKGDNKYEYELTPFRSEGNYSDVRHPDDIHWTHDLLLDSMRRDFRINCVYMCHLPIPKQEKKQEKKITTDELSTILKREKHIYLSCSNTYIVQDHRIIKEILYQGENTSETIEKYITLSQHGVYEDIQKNKEVLTLILDPQLGIHDMIDRRIETVGNPKKRFEEDALRILRGIRFPNILNQFLPDKELQNAGFDFDKETRNALCEHANLVSHIAKERIHEELVKAFSRNNPFGYICLLDEIGLLPILFPSVEACKANKQPIRYHPFDTYTHTLLTLHALQKINTHYLAKLAMLYHDVGKPNQYAYIKEQKEMNPNNIDMSGYIHHADSGAETAKKEYAALGFSKKECEEIFRYIKRHHRPGEILTSNQKNRTKKIRQLLSEGGISKTCNLIDIAIADRLGQFNPLQGAAIQELQDMKQKAITLHDQEGRFTLQQLAINGNDIVSLYNIQPGPKIGDILRNCFDWVLGDVPSRNTKSKIIGHLKTFM